MEPATKRARSTSTDDEITFLSTVWTKWPIGPSGEFAKIVGTVMTTPEDFRHMDGGVMVEFQGCNWRMYVKLAELHLVSEEEEADPSFACNTGRSAFWHEGLRVVRRHGSNVKPDEIRLGHLLYKLPLTDTWCVGFDDYMEQNVPTDHLIPLQEFKDLK